MPITPRPCDKCGTMIPVERLEAVPQTRRCIDCVKKFGADTHAAVTTKNTGSKPGIKQTGADYDVRVERKD